MRGAVFLGNKKIEIRNFPDPTPGPGEVVIQMKASGMCGSDLKFYRPPPGEAQKALGLGSNVEPFIGGHEPCGVIAARGLGVSEREAPIGQRVMNHHYAGCGVCGHCRVGWSQLCRAGITVYGVTGNGGHAEYLKAPARTMVPLPDELSFSEGAAVSCGTGTAFGALRRMHAQGGQTLAVFGQGPVGLSATLIGAKMGARVIAVETNKERLALANGLALTDPAALVARLRENQWLQGYCDPALWPSLAPYFGADFKVETAYDRKRVDDYSFGITRAAGAIAETGTIVLNDATTSRRLGALTPWVHIAVVERTKFFSDLPEAVAGLGHDNNVIWVTGPSKTADVEGILIEGVHGPGIQIALVLG